VLVRRALFLLVIISQIAVSCTSDDLTAVSPPSTVSQASVAGSGVSTQLRIGMVLNISAPTAARDEHLRDVFESTIDSSPDNAIARLETIQIDEESDVGAAVNALRGLGVTVLVTTCDNETVPSVVDAGLAANMLVLAGCATIPRPEFTADSELFFDVSALPASAETAARSLDLILDDDREEPVAIFRSDLLPDVERECSAIENELGQRPVSLTESFTELVDDPMLFVEQFTEPLNEVGAIVLCSLSPTTGDFTTALRDAGIDHPVLVPWFSDDQPWSDDTNNVWIIGPSSRYGDDPVSELNELYGVVDEPETTDILAADTLTVLVAAVERTGSANPARLAEVISSSPIMGLGGELVVNDLDQVERSYRLIEVSNGAPEFSELVPLE